MHKTYDGRSIGKAYRFLSPADKILVSKIKTRTLMTAGVCTLLGVAGYGILILPLLAGISLAMGAGSLMGIFKDDFWNTDESAETRFLSKYTIISESMDDLGRVKTLIEWHNGKTREWVSFQ